VAAVGRGVRDCEFWHDSALFYAGGANLAFRTRHQNPQPDQLGTSVGLACGTVDGTVENWAGKEVLVHNEDTFKRLVADVEARTGRR